MAFILPLSEILVSTSIPSSLLKHLLRTEKDLRSLPHFQGIERKCRKTETVLWMLGEDTSLLLSETTDFISLYMYIT